MAVLKNKTQGNYTLVSQNIMRDTNLSLTERGMLLTLLSLPDNWHLTLKGLSLILPDGRDKIAKTLNSLIDKGYLTREQSRSGGKFGSTDLEVHESPVPCNDPASDAEMPASKKAANEDPAPCPENPDTVNPDTDIPDTEKPCPINPTQYSNNKSNNNTSKIHRVCAADTLTGPEYDRLVSEFGKAAVDYQIQRIKDKGYKGCLNYKTVKSWCAERQHSTVTTRGFPAKKNSFYNFEQRTDYDYAELEKQLLQGVNSHIIDTAI